MTDIHEISGTTEVLGLIGNPVEHTLSPVIHNTLSERLNRNLVYLPFPVRDDPVQAVKGAFHLGIRGMNVTVPHKTAVIPALSGIDPAAEVIGAVNTLVRTDEGFRGYNTDMPGLKRALAVNGISLSGKQVVILGAGGASRAAAALALFEGASGIFLINRTKGKAEAIADDMKKHFKDHIIPLSKDEYRQVPEAESVFIQCTSLGLKGKEGLLIEDRDFYRKAVYGYDLVYNPAETPFLKLFKELGIPGENGLTMLLYQGMIAYELWTGETVTEDLAAQVLTQLKRKVYGENILLAGFMGSGKSTVGRALAGLRGMDFLDTDTGIVEEQGRSIRDIFEEKGEEGFRDIETAYMERLSKTAVNTVIATGGGMVLRRENRELMKNTGRVVLLTASEETTFQRVKEDNERPLLDSRGENELRTRISRMLTARSAAYLAAADKVVETDGKTVDEILEEIQGGRS